MIFKPGNKPDVDYPGLTIGSAVIFQPCGIDNEKIEQKSRQGPGTYFQDKMWGLVSAAKGHEAEFRRMVRGDERAEVNDEGEVNVKHYAGYKGDQPNQDNRMVRTAIDAGGKLLVSKALDTNTEKVVVKMEPVDFNITAFRGSGNGPAGASGNGGPASRKDVSIMRQTAGKATAPIVAALKPETAQAAGQAFREVYEHVLACIQGVPPPQDKENGGGENEDLPKARNSEDVDY